MIEGQGLFQLAARSQAAARFHAIPQKTKPAIHLTPAMLADAKMKEFWQEAAKTASETVTISDETLKRLDTARRSDNKEAAAEKFRQAKAKLQALRMQAQLAAATGDAKTLRRLAAEAANAAREIANSARGLADGIADTATAGASPNVPAATTADSGTPPPTDPGAEAAAKVHADIKAAGNDTAPDPAKDPTAAYLRPAPADADPKAWGQEALRKLGDDARSAIAQARGIIAFLANAARALRKHQSDPEEEKYFNELQRAVGDAEHDLDAAIGDAGREIGGGDAADAPAFIGESGTAAAESTTVEVSVTTVAVSTAAIGAGANFLV